MSVFFEAHAGEAIWNYAERLIAAAAEEGDVVIGIFNDIQVQAYPDSTVREIQYLFEARRALRFS